MTDLTKIIKRLELIKNLIFLEEVEDIAEQITKFKHFEANEDVRNIIALLQQKAFKNAIIAIDIFLSKYNQGELKLIPYRKADKWGFCTSDKKIIIDCIYSYVKNFADGLAMVEGNCNYNSVKGILEYPLGFINMKGELVIDCLYSRAASFSEGLAAVEINNKWGFIDRNGQLAIPLMYRNAESFFDELARVTLNDQSFLINKKNETVSIYDFSEGMAKTIKNNKWGFIDRNQNLAIPCIYDKVENFSEGLARVYKNNKSGFTDKTGELVVPFIYDLTSDFSNGYATVRLNTGWGIINRTGELIFFEKGFSVSPGSFQRVNSEIVLYIRYNFTT